MAITRIKNNQITDATITNVKIVSGTLTGDKMNPDLTFNSNLVLNGNLTVTGNVTAVQSTTTQVTDPLLTLGLGNAGTSYDLGLILTRGSGGNRFIGWKENAGAFVFINTTEDGLTTGNIATTAYANVVFGNATTLGSSTFGGITLSGNTISASGALTVRSDAGTITVSNAAIISGAATLSSTLSVVGAATVASLTSNAGIIATTGSFSSNLTGAALTVNASATIGSTLGVTGNIAGSGITLTGSGTLVGSLSASGGLQATPIGNAAPSTALFTTVGASSNVTAAALTVNGTATIGSTLGVTGNITGSSATLSGSQTVGTTLGVGGNATVGNLGTAGTISTTNTTNSTGVGTGAVVVAGGASFAKDVWIGANLYVSNLFATSTSNLSVQDPLLYLTANVPYPYNYEIGMFSHFIGGAANVYQHTGFVRDHLDGTWKAFSNVNTEPTITIDFANAQYDAIKVGSVTALGAITSNGAMSIGSNATVNGLSVNNTATIGSTLGVTGNINGSSLTLSGSQVTTGAARAGTLNVDTKANVGTDLTIVAGNLYIGATANATTFTNPIIVGIDSGSGYVQQVLQNTTGTGSADYAAYANNGNDTHGWMDMGITGNTFSDANYTITGSNDGYIFANGVTGNSSLGGNLVIATGSGGATRDIVFATGGFTSNKEVMRFSNSAGALQIKTTTSSTGSTSGALVVTGGVGIQGTLNVQTAANLGNVTFNDTTISSNVTNTGLTINPNGTGTTTFNSALNNSRTVINGTRANTLVVSGAQVGANVDTFVSGAGFQIGSNDSMLLPVGPIGTRPGSPVAGMFRFTTTTNNIEWYDGSAWQTASTNFTVVTANTQTGNGITANFTLPVANASTAGTIISINGVVQEPTTAYAITGNLVTFTEAPASTDRIDFRVFTTTTTVTAVTDIAGTTGLFYDTPTANSKITIFKTFGNESFSIQANSQARFTGNVVPSANITYSLGSTTNRWKDLWLSGSTIVLGNVQIKEAAGQVAFYAADGSTPAPAAFNSIDHAGTNGTGNIGASGNGFNTVFAKATSAQYADLAENYLSDNVYQPGTVLDFGGVAEVTISTANASTRVAGVISTNPAYLMNDAHSGAGKVVPIALQGRVPCFVTGRVRKGDMMVSNGDGTARAEANPKVGSVIGKALENFDGTTGVIEVVVGRV